MKLIKSLLIMAALALFGKVQAKVLIFTYSYNRPDFIEIQHKTFQKFLLDDYEFIVFNDAIDESMCLQIEQMCKKHEIFCLRIPQELHDPVYNASARNCDVVNYSLETIGFNHDDIVTLLDSDMFLIKEFSIRDYLHQFDLAGWPQNRNDIQYLWIGLVFLNMATMPNKNTINFNCGLINNTLVDSGGFSYYYLQNHPKVRVRYLENILYVKDFFCSACLQNNESRCDHCIDTMKRMGLNDPLINLISQSPNSIMEIYLNNTFLHYRAGSNWNYESKEYHEQKTILLNHFIQDILNEK